MKRTLATVGAAVALAVAGAWWIDSHWPFPGARQAMEGVRENRGRLDTHEAWIGENRTRLGEHDVRLDAQGQSLAAQGERLDAQSAEIATLKEEIAPLREEIEGLRKAQQAAEQRASEAEADRDDIHEQIERLGARERAAWARLDEVLTRLERLEKAFSEAQQP